MKYLKIIYIELLYLICNTLFLYRLNNLNKILKSQDDYKILSYNNYQPLHFLFISAIFIIIAIFIIKYRWNYIFNCETEEFEEIFIIIIANIIIIFFIYYTIVFINNPILRAVLKTICMIGFIFEGKSTSSR